MKTRIIHPDKLWFNKDFHDLSLMGRLLVLYLLTNRFIELTPTYKCPDLAIKFDLGLSDKELEKVKLELTEKKLFYFYKEWVDINNNFSYCDYFGQIKVMEAKQNELNAIPMDILRYFEEVKNQLPMGYKPNINHKSEIINHKEGGVGGVKFDRQELLTHLLEKKVDRVLAEKEINKFIDWWTEENQKGKQKWQDQKFFDVKRRLNTWIDRAKPDYKKEDDINDRLKNFKVIKCK